MVHTEEYKGHTIVIDYDTCSECYNPRDNDNLGTMLCFHRRYTLGDPHDPQDTSKEANKMGEINPKDMVQLPLYLYDHGGITISTDSFIGRAQHAEWDSGLVGWIYVTHAKIRKELDVKRVTKETIKRVIDILKDEVHEYDAYLRGDVYAHIVTDETGEVVSSCGGFIDCEEVCLLEARNSVDWIIAEREAKDAEEKAGLGSPPWTTA